MKFYVLVVFYFLLQGGDTLVLFEYRNYNISIGGAIWTI